MDYLKKYEELDFNQTSPLVAISDITNYYLCNNCKELFKLFNKQSSSCQYCGDRDIKLIPIDRFYDEVNKKIDKDKLHISNDTRQKEKETFYNISDLVYQNESINQTRLQKIANLFVSTLLSPISIPIFSNLSADRKAKVIIDLVKESYIDERAEYNILDEIKYDITLPSELNRIWKRINMLSKKFTKYKTLEDYINSGVKFLKITNLVNFRTGEDFNYMINKIREHYAQKTESEWIKDSESQLEYDKIRKRIVKKNASEWIDGL